MDIKTLLIPGFIIGILGFVFAFVLALVAKRFSVPHDARIDRVTEALPGLNCGGCSFPSCIAYAESIFKHQHVPLTFCKPGGPVVAETLAHILGREVEHDEKQVAKLLCRGGKQRAGDEFSYSGIPLCRAAHVIKGGPKMCKQGCMSFGDCFRACKFDAIQMGEQGLPIIDRDKCVACGACVIACPKGLIQLVPSSQRVFVECVNTDKGAMTTEVCEVGCIACRLCEKECPFDAIHVINNIAVIDFAKCTNCGKCVNVCPRNIILQLPRLVTQNEKASCS